MPSIDLRELDFASLPAKGKVRVEYWDSEHPGLGVRVSPNGHRSWTVVYRLKGSAKLQRITLGSLAAIPNVELARTIAGQIRRLAEGGEDPKDVQKSTSPILTTTAVVEIFMERHMRARRRAPGYIAETQRIFDRDVLPTIGTRDIKSVKRSDIVELLDAIVDDGRPVQANRTLASIRKLLNWSLDRGYIDSNPIVHMSAPSRENSCERVLAPAELRVVWLAASRLQYPYGPLVQLLILTAQRRNEVARAPWSEFGDWSDATWRIPGKRTKNKRPNEVFLSADALAILQSILDQTEMKFGKSAGRNFLFTSNGRGPVTGFSNAKQRIDAMICTIQAEEAAARGRPIDRLQPLSPWTFHDLRRTAATLMAEEQEVLPHVVDAILNHVSATIKGVSRTYNRAVFNKPKRQALEAWSTYIGDLASRRSDRSPG